MTTDYIGTNFAANSQWHIDELELIGLVRRQIRQHFTTGRNLLINLTWFGPQFDNGQWTKFDALVQQNQQYDRLFVMAAADPSFLSLDQINGMAHSIGASELYHLGHFDSEWNFNFHSLVIPRYFQKYHNKELAMTQPDWVFLN